MRASFVTGGIRTLSVIATFGALAAIPPAKANLIFTEHVSVNELRTPEDGVAFSPKIAPPTLAMGDSLTICYEISRPSTSPTSDADSVVYDGVRASVKFGDDTLFTTDHAVLTVWNLINFYGIYVTDDSSSLFDFLASSSPAVLSNGFLAPNLPITDFDTQADGSVFANGQVIGFQTQSYQFSGDLPTAVPVPEPASYGAIAGAALLAIVFGKRLRR